jgi:DNA-binding CsgD family transcriptional regulator
MRQMTLEQQRLYSDIESDPSTSDLARQLIRIGEIFGLAYATFLIMPAKTDTCIASLVIETNLPPAFFEDLDRLSPPKDSATYDAVRGTVTPVTWSAEQMLRQVELINAPEPASLKHYMKHNLLRGVLIPLTSLDGARHIVRFDGDRPPLMQTEINDLTMLTLHFFQTHQRSRYPLSDNPCGLTERELEIVRWTATGKTSAEIGLIMSLSDHTVNAYMNNAAKKLDCVNRTHVVAKALRMRVIS